MDLTPSKIKFGAEAAPTRLKLLITVVNREKAEFYMDLMQGFEINMQTVMLGHGTANTETQHMLGLADKDKALILGIIREDKAPAALEKLEQKFKTIKNGKGIACTVPLTSTIGVAVYRFLSNNRKGADTKWNSHSK